MQLSRLALALALPLAAVGCADPASAPNPFLQDQSNPGKEDTAYQNPDGREVEVDLEADIQGSSWTLADGPAQLGQFAMTYLRNRGTFYLESLAEDATSGTRVEWLVDGAWITAAQAAGVSSTKLTHFRIRGVNAVLLLAAQNGAAEGKVYTARVPKNPSSIMADAGTSCADENSHIGLDQSVYWYLWNPDKSGCKVATQDMKITLSRLLPTGRVAYPEYDQLVADGKVTAVILFGQIGDGAIADDDIGMVGMRTMASWLGEGGYTEIKPAPVGQRFRKHIGQVDFEIDLYSPKDFSGLGDMAHFANLQKAISEHEIVVYDGHSMLGASDFWERPQYPSFYQIFLYGGCLGYEYYVRPILKGKGGWDKVDIMSSVVEVSAGANEFAGPVLAKVAWALDHKYQASWKDLLVAVKQRVYDSTFGVSGARENCFSPGGSLCAPAPGPGASHRYVNSDPIAIPDNTPAGVTRVVNVPDSLVAQTVTVELDISHTYISDLEITVSHAGQTATVWSRAGGAAHDLKQTFTLDAFAAKDAQGDWVLSVVDRAAVDVGTVNSFAVSLQ